MSIPQGQNDTKKKKREPLPGESKGAGVQSAVGNTDRVPLDSVNATQQPLTANMHPPTINSVVTTEQTSLPNVQFQEHVNTPYDANAGAERVAKNAGLLSMIDEAKKLDEEYKTKAEKASQQAKMAAWGNLFTALGQVAGGAKQTYVRPENKYLAEAMAKSDKAREVYEAIKMKNKQAQDAYKAQLLAQDEAAHYAREKAINEGIDKNNKLLLEFAKTNPTKVKNVYDPNKKKEMAIAQQNADASSKRAEAAMIKANKDDNKPKGTTPYINYQDYNTKINYNLNESEALRIAKYLAKNKGYTNETLGLVATNVKGTIEDIKDRALLKSEVLAYIEGNPNDEYVLKVLKGSKDRERSQQSNLPLVDIN